MKKLLNQLKKPVGRVVQLVLIFGAAFVVLLYFLGAYDLSFLDRYKLLDDSRTNTGGNLFAGVIADLNDEAETSAPDEQSTDNGEGSTQIQQNPETVYAKSAASIL